MARNRHRGYCIVNFSNEDCYEKIQKSEKSKNIKYLIVGEEVCPTTGKKHQQAYVNFSNPVEFNSIKKIDSKWNIQAAKGSAEDNKIYCSKDGNFREFGTIPEPGKRNDLAGIKKKLSEGESLTKVVLNDCENLQQIRFAEKLFEYGQKQKRRNWETKVTWVYGPSGCGKSKYAFDKFEGLDYFVAGENTGSFFWDGYEGEEYVIFDDFRGNHMTLTNLLRALDRYEYRVSVKGSSRQLVAKKIIITSIRHPQDVYASLMNEEPIQQLLRRINKIKNLAPARGSGVILSPDY